MIREALKAELLAEFNAIPPLEELQKMYTFSDRHVRQMEEIFAELRKREQKEQYWHTVRKVAIIVIAVLAAVFASVKFVPEVYAYVKEWLMETKEDRIRFEGRSGESVKEDGESLRFELGYVPEGYELEREVRANTGTNLVYYSNCDREILKLEYRDKSTERLVAVNTESAFTETVNIGGMLYYIFDGEGREKIIIWEYGENLFKLKGVLEKTQMINIASSVVGLE